MVGGGKFTFIFHFSTGATLASLPRHFPVRFHIICRHFWTASHPVDSLVATRPPKRVEIWRTLLEKKENFRQTFLTVSVCHHCSSGQFHTTYCLLCCGLTLIHSVHFDCVIWTACALQIYSTKYSEVFINLKCPQHSLGNFMERFTYV